MHIISALCKETLMLVCLHTSNAPCKMRGDTQALTLTTFLLAHKALKHGMHTLTHTLQSHSKSQEGRGKQRGSMREDDGYENGGGSRRRGERGDRCVCFVVDVWVFGLCV